MENNQELKKYKRLSIILGAVALLLLITTVISFFRVKTIVVDRNEKVELNVALQNELDTLLFNHEKIKVEYGELSSQLSQKDSVIQANAQEIRKLIARQADYNRIKRKLELLRNISQEYVLRIDSLYRANEELTTENIRIKEDVRRIRKTASDLETKTDSLQGKIHVASKLRAYGVAARTFNVKSGGNREEPTDRLRRTDRIKVTFVLSENPVAEPGNKTIYCRIARPDGKVLYIDGSDAYSFTVDGERLQYSIKQTINYDRRAKSITLIWDVKDYQTELIPGRYYAMVYIDGYQIGEASFDLK